MLCEYVSCVCVCGVSMCDVCQGRRSRCGRCGGRRTNNMLSLASKLLNLAVSSQDCTRNDLRRSKFKIFLGEGPRPPLCDVLRALAASRTGFGSRAARAIALPRFHHSK